MNDLRKGTNWYPWALTITGVIVLTLAVLGTFFSDRETDTGCPTGTVKIRGVGGTVCVVGFPAERPK